MGSTNTYRRRTRLVSGLAWAGRMAALLARVVAVCAGVLVLSLALVAAYRWATSTSLFALRTVAVHGVQRVQQTEIVDLAGLKRFGNLLHLSLQQVKKGVVQHPWVKTVTVSREFPHTLHIRVRERVPVFWRIDGDRILYADRKGELIAPVQVQGFVSLPLLLCDPGKTRDAQDLALVQGKLERGPSPFSLAEVAWIRFQDNDRVVLALLTRDLRIVLGRRALPANLDGLCTIWRDVQDRGELHQVQRILVFAGTGWVGYRSEGV